MLAAHPDVADVGGDRACRASTWGETPLALVVTRPGSQASTAASLRDWANARVGKVQRVSAVELRDELPRVAIGKMLKRELRARYWKPAGEGPITE